MSPPYLPPHEQKKRRLILFFARLIAQRAHANFTENLTPYLTALLVAGLRYPVYAGGIGALWSLSRFGYAYGYTQGGPKGREV